MLFVESHCRQATAVSKTYKIKKTQKIQYVADVKIIASLEAVTIQCTSRDKWQPTFARIYAHCDKEKTAINIIEIALQKSEAIFV